MRNSRTDKMAAELTIMYKESGLTVDKFIEQFALTREIFSIDKLHDSEYLGQPDTYACFSRMVIVGKRDGEDLYDQAEYYYWGSSDRWYCKL